MSTKSGQGYFSYCNATPEQCDQIQQAINELLNNPGQVCQNMGAAAQDRFNSTTDGFEYDPNTEHYGYVLAQFQIDETSAVSTGITYLGPNGFQPGELGNTIAHEEVHHGGSDWDHSQGTAATVGYACAGTT